MVNWSRVDSGFYSDFQDSTPMLLRYTSKILAEAFGRQGDFPLGKFPNAVTDAACNTKIMPVDSTLKGWLKF